MSLTGTPFLLTLGALAVVALALPLVLWSRLPGPRALRAAARVLMLLFAQGTAVALVFVLVNNQNNLYDNWADLLGTGDHVQQAADLGADGTGGIALKRLPKVRQTFTGDPAGVRVDPAQGPGVGRERRGLRLAAAAVRRARLPAPQVPGRRAAARLPRLGEGLVRVAARATPNCGR